MNILGRWRIVELPGYEDDYADMVEPAYILLGTARGEFAFGCVTGSFAGGGNHDAVEFEWDGNERWTRPAVKAGLNSSRTDRSRARLTSTMAMISPSLPAAGLLL